MDKTLEALKKANKTLDRINGKMDKVLMMMGRLIIIALAVKLVICLLYTSDAADD